MSQIEFILAEDNLEADAVVKDIRYDNDHHHDDTRAAIHPYVPGKLLGVANIPQADCSITICGYVQIENDKTVSAVDPDRGDVWIDALLLCSPHPDRHIIINKECDCIFSVVWKKHEIIQYIATTPEMLECIRLEIENALKEF
jgi:hypothetical protein